MTIEEFDERLRELVSEAEDAGLELPELIAAMVEQADGMQVSVDE